MKDRRMRLLLELLKDSKRSDRKLAEIMGLSQPTITRMRQRLVEEGTIQGFTAIPNFEKIGYQIMAITVAKAKATLTPDELEKAKKLVLENPRVIFVASAEGMGGNGVMISIHKSFADYHAFMNKLKLESRGFMEKVDTILVSLDSQTMIKPLSLAYLAEQEKY